MANKTQVFTGLDLGQAQEFSAVAVLEKTYLPVPKKPQTTIGHYAVRHLDRFPPGTPYQEVFARLAEMFAGKDLARSILVVDQTAVGKPVIDLLEQSNVRATIRTVTITAGQQASIDTCGGMLVPKKELVGLLQVLLQGWRLQIAKDLAEAETLARELNNFQMKVPISTLDTQLLWREGIHDDLVFAVAIAAWEGERHQPYQGFMPYVTASGAWFQYRS